MGLVLGQHHRTLGQVAEVLVQLSKDLVAVGVALGDQPGPTPGGDLADPATQRGLADGWPAQLLPKSADRPGLGLGEQPQDALAQPWATQPGPARSGRSASPLAPWLL